MEAQADRDGPELCVAIASRAPESFLRKTIESVVGQLVSGDELVLVYTGPEEAGAERVRVIARAVAPEATTIVRLRAGISEARNAALEATRCSVVCFIDDDETAGAGWLESLRTAWTVGPERLAVVGGPIRPVWNGGRPPWLHDHLTSVLSLIDLGEERLVLGRTLGDSSHVRFAWGGNMSVRRSETVQAGGFDLNMGARPDDPYGRGEEEELQERLVAQGLEVWYEPGALVWHHIQRERLSLDYFRRIRRTHAREEGKEPHAFRRGAIRVARSGARFALGLVRRNRTERDVARLGFSYGLTVVGVALSRRVLRKNS